MRAYLIVPPDNPEAVDAALGSGADALVFDAGRMAPEAVANIAELRQRSEISLCARVVAPSAPDFERALSLAQEMHAEAIILPSTCARDIVHLAARLAVAEAEAGLRDGQIRIIALAADAKSALDVVRFAKSSARVAAIGWDARAIAADLNATAFDDTGAWLLPLAQVRSHVRLAAAAAGVEAIDDLSAGAGRTRTVDLLSEAKVAGFGAILVDDAALVRRIPETG